MSSVSQRIVKHNVEIRRGDAGIHRSQVIVERCNNTLAERSFGHQLQYAQEMVIADKRLWVI